MGRIKREPGFTLIELVVVIGIAGILMSIAIPSYTYVTSSNRVSSEINALLGDMQYARAEAIKEGQTVTICSSTDGASCNGGTTWAGGWIVFTDPNNNQTVDTGETVFRHQVTFHGSDTLNTASVAAVTFNRAGFASGLTGTLIFSLHNAASVAAFTRCLEVSNTGMLLTATNGVSGCS